MDDELKLLNDYEKAQVRGLREWKHEEPSVVSKTVRLRIRTSRLACEQTYSRRGYALGCAPRISGAFVNLQ